MAGSGLCHTDFTGPLLRTRSYWKEQAGRLSHSGTRSPAGWKKPGTGVMSFRHGDAVAVNPSLGKLRALSHVPLRQREPLASVSEGLFALPGVGYDGGHAPFVLVPEARFLVPIGDLNPILAAPLTDAGITTYSAMKPALPHIWPGSAVVVIGVGGLGLYAVQFLRLLTGARVIAVDSTEARLKLARGGPAPTTSSRAVREPPPGIRDLTGGVGASFVPGLRGNQPDPRHRGRRPLVAPTPCW